MAAKVSNPFEADNFWISPKPPLERREPPVIIALVILLRYLIGCLYRAKRALIGLLFCFSVSDSPCVLRQNKSTGKVAGGGAAEDLIVIDVHSFFFLASLPSAVSKACK